MTFIQQVLCLVGIDALIVAGIIICAKRMKPADDPQFKYGPEANMDELFSDLSNSIETAEDFYCLSHCAHQTDQFFETFYNYNPEHVTALCVDLHKRITKRHEQLLN